MMRLGGITKGVVLQIQSRFEFLASRTSGENSDVEAIGDVVGDDDGDEPMAMISDEAAMVEQMMEGITNQPGEAPKVQGSMADLLAVELRKDEDLERFRADTDILDSCKRQKFSSPLLLLSNIALTILSIPKSMSSAYSATSRLFIQSCAIA